MSSDDDATATPPKEVTPPPRREGEERKGGERNEPVEASGCGYSSDESDEDNYGAHEEGVAFMRGECHDNPRKSCVCGGCIMINKFRLKIHFARHEYELKKLKEEIEELKKTK